MCEIKMLNIIERIDAEDPILVGIVLREMYTSLNVGRRLKREGI